MKNNIVTAISNNGGILVHAIDSTQIVADMEKIHVTSATASAALGRLLTAAALMGSMQKGDLESLTLTVKGGGSIGTLTAISDSSGNVRGCAGNPRADAPLNPNTGKLDVGGIVGTDGFLYVIRDLRLKEPYTGQVALVSGEIAEDITSYYAQSEQIPTVCALGVLVHPDLTIRAAGGYILQLMPGASEKEIERVEQNVRNLDAVSTMIDRGMPPQDVAFQLLAGFRPELLKQDCARYQCNCSLDKMQRIMKTLGEKDLFELAEEAPETEIVCSYCNEKYIFSSDQLRKLAT
jgi:molecular chaperone Hsp33